ncbi:MAG: hypothetical protein ITG01_02365 [Comamonas sp.]|nr:hypothetical protein [Comamonas sp.]
MHTLARTRKLSTLATGSLLLTCTSAARRGRYVLQADASYASFSSTTSLPLGLQARAKIRQSSLTLIGRLPMATLAPGQSRRHAGF